VGITEARRVFTLWQSAASEIRRALQVQEIGPKIPFNGLEVPAGSIGGLELSMHE